MKAVLADSVYFFALLNPRDRLHACAKRYAAQSSNPILTTAWVLTEVADGLSERTKRRTVVQLIEILQGAADVEIIPPSQELFQRGLERYAQRLDKDWSLTHCISFVVMEEHGLTEALTADHHFKQAGFATLLS